MSSHSPEQWGGSEDELFQQLAEIEQDPSIVYAELHKYLIAGCEQALNKHGRDGVIAIEGSAHGRMSPFECQYLLLEKSTSEYNPAHFDEVEEDHTLLIMKTKLRNGNDHHILVQTTEVSYRDELSRIGFNSRVLHLFAEGSYVEFTLPHPAYCDIEEAYDGLFGPIILHDKNQEHPSIRNHHSRFYFNPEVLLPQAWNYVEDIEEYDFSVLHQDLHRIAEHFWIYFPDYWQNDIQ